MTNEIQLIASDLDNTLLDENGQVPAGFYDRVHALHARGIHFVAASGRAIATLEENFKSVLGEMTLLAENGGALVRDGELIFHHDLTHQLYHDLITFTRAQDDGGVPLYCALDASYLDATDAASQAHLGGFVANVRLAPELLALNAPGVKYTVYYPDNSAYEHAAMYRASSGIN